MLEAINYLKNGIYPVEYTKDQKRKLRSKCKRYSLRDGKLCMIHFV